MSEHPSKSTLEQGREDAARRSPNWPSMETTDAMEWTKAWMSKFPYTVGGSLEDIEGTMLGWFANAIETGRAAGRDEVYDQVDGVDR